MKCKKCLGNGYLMKEGIVHTCWACMGSGKLEEDKKEIKELKKPETKKQKAIKEIKQRKKKDL